MQHKAYIFMGSQGSGKGTQARFLEEYLKENDSERGVFMFDTGTFLRELAAGDSFTSKRMHDSLEKGNLQPVFLASYAWSKALVERFNGTDHVIIQGSPRTILESDVMNDIFPFFNLDPVFVYLNVNEEVAKERLMDRGRNDDTEEAVQRRLNWFKEIVIPVLDRYREDEKYTVIDVDANKSVEEVREEMISKLEI